VTDAGVWFGGSFAAGFAGLRFCPRFGLVAGVAGGLQVVHAVVVAGYAVVDFGGLVGAVRAAYLALAVVACEDAAAYGAPVGG
jgi:hypothetical protein